MKKEEFWSLNVSLDFYNIKSDTILTKRKWLMWDNINQLPVCIEFSPEHKVVIDHTTYQEKATWQYLPKLDLFSIVYSDDRICAYKLQASYNHQAVLLVSYEDDNEALLLLPYYNIPNADKPLLEAYIRLYKISDTSEVSNYFPCIIISIVGILLVVIYILMLLSELNNTTN